MVSYRDQAKVLSASRRSRTLSGSDKAKTAVGVAVAYVEDVLGLTTQPSEFAADRSRSLFSDSLLYPPGKEKLKHIGNGASNNRRDF